MSEPTPEEVLTAWDGKSNAPPIVEVLREAIRQRDEARAALDHIATYQPDRLQCVLVAKEALQKSGKEEEG